MTRLVPFVVQFEEVVEPEQIEGHYDSEQQIWVWPVGSGGASGEIMATFGEKPGTKCTKATRLPGGATQADTGPDD